MSRTKKAKPEKRSERCGPTKAALQKIRRLYDAWLANAPKRALAWGCVSNDKEYEVQLAADNAEWKEIQIAFIKATSYVNSYTKWPLVNERAVVAILDGNRVK